MLIWLFWWLPVAVSGLSCLYWLIKAPRSEEAKESLTSIIEALLSYYLALFLNVTLFLAMTSRRFGALAAPYHLLNVPWNNKTFIIYLLVADFWFYVQHWLSHKIPILWIGHGVHHTGTKLTAPLILRGSFVDGILGSLITMIPMSLFGFSPYGIFICRQYIFLNQGFCHTESNWPRFLDRFWVTPRVHRIHHGYMPQHIDRNFGGFLSIWDSLFRTKTYDEQNLRYGLSDGFNSKNPIKVFYYLPVKLIRTLLRTKNPKYLFVHYQTPKIQQASEAGFLTEVPRTVEEKISV
jgi:sterol desaturase/sphingolipid hydroxylase (fatty acid hydroxylase superfamily)